MLLFLCLLWVFAFLSACIKSVVFPAMLVFSWFHVGSMFDFDFCFWFLLFLLVLFVSCFKMFLCCFVCVVCFCFDKKQEGFLISCLLFSGSFFVF